MKDLTIGIVSGVICAFFIWVFNSFWNVNCRRDIHFYTERLILYLESINNDLTWGMEDQRESYYTDLLNKIHFSYLYMDNARRSIRLANLLWHNRKRILKQYSEIEAGLNKIMCEVEAAAPEKERVARMESLAKEIQTTDSNMLIVRANFILNLVDNRTFAEALEETCIDDSKEMRKKIEESLSK